MVLGPSSAREGPNWETTPFLFPAASLHGRSILYLVNKSHLCLSFVIFASVISSAVAVTVAWRRAAVTFLGPCLGSCWTRFLASRWMLYWVYCVLEFMMDGWMDVLFIIWFFYFSLS